MTGSARSVRSGPGSVVRVVAALAVLVAGCAYAFQTGGAAVSEARALYASGAFAEAYEAAIAADDASAQVLAAEAAIAHALYVAPEDELRSWLARAGDALDRVLADESTLAPAEVQRALLAEAQVRGEVARRSSALANFDLPEEVRELLDRALAAGPEAPAARLALGMWHVELAARGVGWLFGASGRDGLELVEGAVAAAPDTIAFRVEYARALHLRDRTADALAQLNEAMALPAREALDRHQQERARDLREEWE